jgi:hypothetical protein
VTALEVIDWSYDRWTRELARFFFSGSDSGSVVAFCADGPTLASLAGTTEPVAIASLRAAVEPCVMPGYRFGNIGRLASEWERAGMIGPPPSLPLLALTVLAASFMQREGDVASHNFYRRFREQLDPLDEQPGIPGDYGDWIPSFWRQLEKWLNEHLGGACGLLVLQSQEALDHNPYGKNIAHALQQAVFRVSDRRHLYRFFRAIGVDPEDDDAEPTELRRALAIWASRHQPGAARLARLATESLFVDYSLDLLARLALSWDGQLVEEATGKPESAIRLCLRSRPLTLSLLASRDERMPLKVDVDGPTGLISLEATGGWFRPMPIPIELTATTLADGFELVGDEVALRFEPRSILALRFDDTAGGWVDVDHIKFGELHQLLVRSDVRAKLTAFCEGECPGSRLDAGATPLLPSGWFLIRDVRLDRRPSAQPPAELAALLRSGGGARMRLVGGLKLPHLHHAYLVGGAPFLALPEDIEERAFLLSKGGSNAAHTFVATGSEFPIGALELESGHYEIKYGPASIDFDLIEGIVETAGEDAGSIETDGVVGLHAPNSAGTPITEPAPEDSELSVLLGPCPSDVELVRAPKWLSDLLGDGGLSWIAVDAWPDFQPTWRLTRTRAGNSRYMASPVGSEPPSLTTGGESWSKLLLQASLEPSMEDSATSALWEEYQQAARSLR